MNITVIGILVFIALTFVLAIFVFIKHGSKGLTEKDQRFIILNWQEILVLLDRDPKHAVLDADKLLDHLLKKKGYSGSLGEMLKQAGSMFTNLNGLWFAHKLRNRIAHELDANVSNNEAQNALSEFKRAFRDLGVKL